MRITATHFFGPACALVFLAGCSSSQEPSGAGGGAGVTSSSSGAGGAAVTTTDASSSGVGGGLPSDGGPPPGFWDVSDIPAAKNVLTFKFLNRTNGKYPDSQVFWSFKNNGVNEVHSIAEAPTYDMPANSSGRMYFYLGSPDSKYYDFIEHTIGADQYNGNTTRVDAFGLKIAMKLHCADGFELDVGEDYETFQEDRAVTFKKFIDEVPAEFKHLAQVEAPYRILQPGAGEFKTGKASEHYFDAYADEMWAANLLGFPKPGPNGDGLGAYPDVSAALMRHVGAEAGTFSPDGKLLNKDLWKDSSTFYKTGPANYYAKFWHTHGLGGKAYGFPYDDVGSYSTYVSHKDPQYLVIAIGW